MKRPNRWQRQSMVVPILFVFILGTTILTGEARGQTQEELQFLRDLMDHVTIVQGEINGVAGPHVIITGANVHVRNNAGSSDTDGLGT